MSTNKKYIIYSTLFLLGLSILITVFWLYIKVQRAVNMLNPNSLIILSFFITLLFIAFGILIEWSNVLKIYKNGVQIKKTPFFSSLLLLIIVLIPRPFFVGILSIPGFYNIKSLIAGLLSTSIINVGLSILAGIALVRSLAGKNA